MAHILLTGGRAPAALELARIFHAAGHTVYMAESLRYPLSRTSRAIARHYHVPPPNRDPTGYWAALVAIITRHQIELLLPTCEEIFWVAKGRHLLTPHCRVLVAPLAELRTLHHKYAFAQQAAAYGLAVPPTMLITHRHDLDAARQTLPDFVLKPAYSRFATQTILHAQTIDLSASHPTAIPAPFHPTEAQPWVAQAFVAGRHLCTYSLAHAGQLVAHTAYGVTWRAGQGATVHFAHLDHPQAEAWVRHFVAQSGFSGQIAFDFIETDASHNKHGSGTGTATLFAIECNPRATSGVHLFAPAPADFAACFLTPTSPSATRCLYPPTYQPAMLAAAMWLYALPTVRSWPALRRWAADLAAGRDVLWARHDPLPALLQGVGLAELLAIAARLRINPLAASTHDIEWNGE